MGGIPSQKHGSARHFSVRHFSVRHLNVRYVSIRILFGVLLVCGLAHPLAAQVLKPFTALRVIKTVHFDIIYPEESEVTAQTLAAFADASYDKVSGLLGITVPRRIPVTITPYTDSFNGVAYSMPYSRIVLYDTPATPEWTSFTDSLEGLFVHELTHVITFNSRSPVFDVLYRIFGGWVLPMGLNSPEFMIEGGAVSIESLDGTGRANDPLIKAKLMQAIYEDSFLNSYQASGMYDLPPLGNAYYDYGGLFNAYLQKQFGMEKYAQLWQSMGRDLVFSFSFYNNGYYRLFERIYGRTFLQVWDEFKESLRIWTIEENRDGIVYEGKGLNKKMLISGTAGGGGRVFTLDLIAGAVLAYDPASGETRPVVSSLAGADTDAYSVAASADGERLLVSAYRYTGSMAQTVVTEYDALRGGRTGRSWQGLYFGQYFRDGVVGISSTRHISNIVYRSASGEAEVLLRGNAELLYANPQALNDTWIVFTAAKQGRRELCFYNYETKQVYTAASNLGDDGERWRYIRGLRVSEGRILFSYDHDGRMYKLGVIDAAGFGGAEPPAAMRAVFSERDFSGGVYMPVAAGDSVYYRGAFATWDALMRFPEPVDSLSGVPAALSLEPWNDADRAAAFADAPYAVIPGTGPAADRLVPGHLASSPYWGITYLNPLQFWIPFPLIHTAYGEYELFGESVEGTSLSLDGAGVYTMMVDPTGNNEITLSAAMDFNSWMGVFDLQWTNVSLGFPLTLTFTDDIDKSHQLYPKTFRQTTATLGGSFSHGLGSERLRFSIAPGFGVGLFSLDPGDGSSAYTWRYQDPQYSVSLGAGISFLQRFRWELFGQGASLELYGRYVIGQELPRFEGLLSTAYEPFLPLRIRFFGAWDQNGMALNGASSLFPTPAFSSIASSEYFDTKVTSLQWLAGGEAEVKLFSLEIQKGLSHIYYNRFFGTLGYRATVYEYGGSNLAGGKAEGNVLGGPYRLAQSLVLRAGLTVSSAIIPAAPLSLSFSLLGYWKISNLNDGKNNDFWYGIGIGLD